MSFECYCDFSPTAQLNSIVLNLLRCAERWVSCTNASIAGVAAEKSKQTKEAASFYDQFLKVCSVAHSTRPELVHAQSFLSQVAREN